MPFEGPGEQQHYKKTLPLCLLIPTPTPAWTRPGPGRAPSLPHCRVTRGALASTLTHSHLCFCCTFCILLCCFTCRDTCFAIPSANLRLSACYAALSLVPQPPSPPRRQGHSSPALPLLRCRLRPQSAACWPARSHISEAAHPACL